MTFYTKNVLFHCRDASVKVVHGTACMISDTKNVLVHLREALVKMVLNESACMHSYIGNVLVHCKDFSAKVALDEHTTGKLNLKKIV